MGRGGGEREQSKKKKEGMEVKRERKKSRGKR